jgi:hypothetical protein
MRDESLLQYTPGEAIAVGGEVTSPGIDFGGRGVVLARDEGAIAVRWPSGMGWAGIGLPRKYFPASVIVYRIIGTTRDRHGERLSLERLLEWELKRRAPVPAMEEAR